MQRYYLRLTGQVARQAHVYTSVNPLRNLENLLRVYIKEARKVCKSIPPILRPLKRKMQNIDDYDMIDVNDCMEDMSMKQRHGFILQLRQGLSVPKFLYTSVWGEVRYTSTRTMFGGTLSHQMFETRA